MISLVRSERAAQTANNLKNSALAGSVSTGQATALTLTGPDAADSLFTVVCFSIGVHEIAVAKFLFGSFSFAEKEKEHPLAYTNHLTRPHQH